MNGKSLANQDFEAFQSYMPWFFEPSSTIVLGTHELRITEEFKQTFPLLTRLVESARVTFLTIDATSYILFAWDSDDGFICGWLNKVEDKDSYSCELVPEHEVLLRNIGGIQESFNQPEDSFSNNQDFMFIGSECVKGIRGWEDYYSRVCGEQGYQEIEYSNFVVFVGEANGALTMYDPMTKEVFLFSHDHSFDNVAAVKNQPEYTFHRLTNAATFTDYVEELARQWTKYLDREKYFS